MSDNHNENSAANPEGGQADLPETATEAIVVRLPDPLHPGNRVVQAQPTNLMAANYVGEMEEGNNNNNDRRRSQAGHATVQLSTAGALGELTQVARDNGARPTPAAEALQQALANEATPSARRRLGRHMAQRREGHEEGLDDSNQEGTVARPSTPADPISPGQCAYLERVARETLEWMDWQDEMARRAAMANGPNGVVNYDEEMNDE
ncbi:hypothetical protein N7528_003230 [Penicillium herquei]|nr:hypothetical protein N7528_003230 [Penicillium herquei]